MYVCGANFIFAWFKGGATFIAGKPHPTNHILPMRRKQTDKETCITLFDRGV